MEKVVENNVKSSRREKIIDEITSKCTLDLLTDLKDWYLYTLQDQKWFQYVVFTTNSYKLAIIMETITEKNMCDNRYTQYLTDSSIFLKSKELVDYYVEFKHFPSILLCDDYLIYGFRLNHIIDGLEKELFRVCSKEYPEKNIEEDRIARALFKAITIHVYAKSWNQTILEGSYDCKLHCTKEKEEEPYQYNASIASIASSINIHNMENNGSIYTQILPQQDFDNIKDRLKEDGFIHTTYWLVEQYSKFLYIGFENKINLILSLRIAKHKYSPEYRIIPFVFLPNMVENETEAVANMIISKLPEQYKEFFNNCREINKKRTFNELITLLFSDAILKDFNKTYNIKVDFTDKDRELIKMARVYNQYGFAQTKQMLNALLGDDYTSLISIADIEKVSKTNLRVLDFETNTKPITRLDIIKRLEEYFYNRICVMGEIWNEIAFHYSPELASKRYARGCCFSLNELTKGYSKNQSQCCLAYLLQMNDAGVISISSYAPNNTTVSGYSQFISEEILAFLLKPMQPDIDIYIPLLSRIQTECERRLCKLTEEIEEYGKDMGWKQEDISNLVQFCNQLEKMGQGPSDYCPVESVYIDQAYGDLLYTGQIKEISRRINLSSELRAQYVKYSDKKYGYRRRV